MPFGKLMRSKALCNFANRIELASHFITSSVSREKAENTLTETISLSLNLLDQIDPFWLRVNYENHVDANPQNPEVKCRTHRFTSKLNDLMHSIGIHQKAIARLGSQISFWNGLPLEYDDLADSLDRICGMIMQDDEAVQACMLHQSNPSSFEVFANTFYGLTLVIATLEAPIDDCQACSASMMFACAEIVSENARKLIAVEA